MHDALCNVLSSFPRLFSLMQVHAPRCVPSTKNFLLGSAISDGGLALLLSALVGLYQMTFAGYFVHLTSIPPVLRWLQWLCPLKYALEALSVNEVNSTLLIEDTLEGVPVSISATLIMNLVRCCCCFTHRGVSHSSHAESKRFSSSLDLTRRIIIATCWSCSGIFRPSALVSSPWYVFGCARLDDEVLEGQSHSLTSTFTPFVCLMSSL
jgi:ABC-2 type transporter